MGKELYKVFKKELDVNFYFSHKVTKVENTGEEVVVTAENEGKIVEIKGDYCLVCIGRRPFTEGLNLEARALQLDRGKFPVDEHTLQTSVPNIYAIGDVIRGAMLAHKAEEEGFWWLKPLQDKNHISIITHSKRSLYLARGSISGAN